MTKFALMLYVNRSGSTLLSRKLSEQSDDICVLPEMGFLLKLLTLREAGVIVKGHDLFKLIASDVRVDALDLSNELLEEISNRNSSSDIASLLTDIAYQRLGRDPALIVFKLNSFIYFRDHLAQALPGLVYIHIVRDPRAVVNSMLKTQITEKAGFDMARGSAVYASKEWRRYVRTLRNDANNGTYFTLKYENLDEKFQGFVRELFGHFSLSLRQAADTKSKYIVSSVDTDIHVNIFKDFQNSRLEAWREELSQEGIEIVECLCWDEMREYGYSPITDGMLTTSRSMAVNYRHLKSVAINFVLTMLFYLRRPNALSNLKARLSLAFRRT